MLVVDRKGEIEKMSIACLAPNRCFLGVGTGEVLNEYSSTAHWLDYKQRQAQMAEAIKLIRALWSGEKVTYTYKGVYYQTRQAKLYTRPRDPISLYVSTLVPTSGRFAGAHGDGLITVAAKNLKLIGGFYETSQREPATQAKIHF
jgi:coenzyme F420-dependent glucose-6-phosphate dehydrogenase